MDKVRVVRMEATYAEHTDNEDGSFSGRMVTRNGVFLPISDDGSVGGLEEWMVEWQETDAWRAWDRIPESIQKKCPYGGPSDMTRVEYFPSDTSIGEWVNSYIATAIGNIIQAAQGGEG